MTRNNSNRIPVPELAASFPGLTLSQLRLLGYCAYRGGFPPNPWTITLYDGHFKLAKGRTERDRNALTEAGLLKDGQVLPRDYFRIATAIIRHFPEWIPAYSECARYRSDTTAWLWEMARVLAPENLFAARELRFPSKGVFTDYFLSVLFNDGYAPFLHLFPPKEAEVLLSRWAQRVFEAGRFDEAAAALLREAAGAHLSRPKALLDQVDAYLYYMTGVLPPERTEGFTMWSQGIRAIYSLYKGDSTVAMETFLRARDLVPEGYDHAFPDRLMTWFYALCLIRDRRRYHSNRSGKAIEDLQKSAGFRYATVHAPTRTMLTHIDEGGKEVGSLVTAEIKEFLEKDRSPIGRQLALTVLRYFRIGDERIAGLGLDPKAVSPIPILRSEQSALLPTTSAEKERLAGLFGGPSVIGSIPRKESWETALGDLTGLVSARKEETATERRLIYFVDDKWITAVIEQSRPAGETEWRGDRLLSRSHLIRGGYPSMDVLDYKLAHALGNKVVDRPDVSVIIPIMAGSGRLFTGQYQRQPYTPLEIREEAPFVAFSGQGGSIEVSSNVCRRPDGSVEGVSVSRSGDGYTVIRTNPVQRDILSHLLGIGSFPLSALPAIRHAISSLEEVIEVRSALKEMAVIPTLRGSTRLCLRITSLTEGDGYGMDISSAPNEEGGLRFPPGEGAEDVYDDTVGEPRFVRRDLQAEWDNFSELKEYLRETLRVEFEEERRCELHAAESLLGVLTWAYDHRDRCFVEWPEGRALRFRGDVRPSDVEVTVNTGVNWFEVEGEVAIGRDKYDLEAILKAMRETGIKGFIRLGDKDYARMTETLRRHLEAVDGMLSGRSGRRRVVPVFRVGHLASVLGDEGGLHATMDEGFKSLLSRMQQAYDSTPEVPTTLKATLRDYQQEGYVWMKRLDAWGAGACLADDMGLGKTVQALAFLLSKATEGPSLVVAPKSVVPNWEIEAARFAPSLRVTVLNGAQNREDAVIAAGPGDLILATYGVLSSESRLLSGRRWAAACLDEAHQIKNRDTRVSAAAMGLEADSRLILTGTPLQNHLGELWNLFQFINPGLLGSWQDFKARYLHGELDEGHREFLRDLVQPFILRRTKEEVLDELPEKIVIEQMVELSPEEMRLYEAMRKYVEDRVRGKGKKGKTPEGEDPVEVSFFAELTRLRLAALSMSLVNDDWTLGSSKTAALMDILDGISAVGGNQAVVFSQFTSYLTEIRAVLDRRGIRHLYLDGQTPLEERRDIVTQFQDGDCPLLLASLKAGGLGLNLTAANYVILLDPWWNPAIESQAMDRAHRIGQQRTVTVIRLVSRHTIEEKILRLHGTKQALAERMLDGTAYSGRLTMDDVLEMVSPFR